MKLRRVMIAAPKSGSGKTTITCALLQALKNRGQQVVSYKCGPDYIDPMFHKKIIGVPSRNLDTFFTSEEDTRKLLLQDRREEDFAVLEGVMGLYDGLGGIKEEGSSYHLAKVTKTPIILVVDTKGMGRSVVSLIAGFLSYDTEHLIKGVILNRMSKSYYEIIKPLIEAELHISVFGYFPEYKEFHIESRHLGLMMPDEITDVREQLQEVSIAFNETVSVDEIVKAAETAVELHNDEELKIAKAVDLQKNIVCVETTQNEAVFNVKTPVIAVAYDEAFCFYYEDNLRLLQKYGAKLQYFSPIHDRELPKGSSALLLGGGYPELYAQKLSENKAMRSLIKFAIDKGMPVVAECGGFMYLHSAITDKEKHTYEMVGAIPHICCYTGKLVRFGYIELTEKQSIFLPEGARIKGHEFHYFDSTDNGSNCVAVKPVTGKTYPCVMEGEQYFIGFPHLYYPSNPAFAKSFVEKARQYKK